VIADLEVPALTNTTHDPQTIRLMVSVTEVARLLGIGRILAYDLVARGKCGRCGSGAVS
jgi:hypothetical protein